MVIASNALKRSFLIIILICISLFMLYMFNGKKSSIETLSQTDLKMLRNQGYKGHGVTIAIIDSGLEPNVLINSNRILQFIDYVNHKSIPYDNYGHGTKVAGIIGGNGKNIGIAPKASFVVIKALNKHGTGDFDDILKGLKWVIKNKEKYNIRVLSLSFGFPVQVPHDQNPLYDAINKAENKNILVVSSAGNNGERPNAITTPGDLPQVLTVGSVRKIYNHYKITKFSSRGLTLSKLKKPDIYAPGTNISTINSKGDFIDVKGTSYSAGLVSGYASLLIEKDIKITVKSLKEKIKEDFKNYNPS